MSLVNIINVAFHSPLHFIAHMNVHLLMITTLNSPFEIDGKRMWTSNCLAKVEIMCAQDESKTQGHSWIFLEFLTNTLHKITWSPYIKMP